MYIGTFNILSGAVTGAAMMVATPIEKAYSGGKKSGALGAVKGFGYGLGLGAVGGVGLAIGGVATGVAQIGRGIYNTPEAVSAIGEGKDW